ncbi:MAG: 50S ribosomal protein L30 [Rickettsiales bacterium]|jgi:ribosomal protein L30|nr:50S ribosomal protein L30 [Rickettsiales bacterium]
MVNSVIEKFEDLDGKEIKIKQLKSVSGRERSQRDTLKSLGLGGIGQEKNVKINKAVYGMVDKVKHLIEIKK